MKRNKIERIQSLAPAHSQTARMLLGFASGDDEQPIMLRLVLQTFAPKAVEVRAPIKWSPAITPPLPGT